MGPTGNPTTPKRWFMPCCLRLLAINVAPSTSLMLFLLLDRADADRRARCRQGPGPKNSPPADYAFMAMAEKGLSHADLLFRHRRGPPGSVNGQETEVESALDEPHCRHRGDGAGACDQHHPAVEPGPPHEIGE